MGPFMTKVAILARSQPAMLLCRCQAVDRHHRTRVDGPHKLAKPGWDIWSSLEVRAPNEIFENFVLRFFPTNDFPQNLHIDRPSCTLSTQTFWRNSDESFLRKGGSNIWVG